MFPLRGGLFFACNVIIIQGAVNEEATAAASGGMVDVSGLRAKLFDICGDLSVRQYCYLVSIK